MTIRRAYIYYKLIYFIAKDLLYKHALYIAEYILYITCYIA